MCKVRLMSVNISAWMHHREIMGPVFHRMIPHLRNWTRSHWDSWSQAQHKCWGWKYGPHSPCASWPPYRGKGSIGGKSSDVRHNATLRPHPGEHLNWMWIGELSVLVAFIWESHGMHVTNSQLPVHKLCQSTNNFARTQYAGIWPRKSEEGSHLYAAQHKCWG